MRETSFDEDIPLSHRQFVENQGYGYSDENTAGTVQSNILEQTGVMYADRLQVQCRPE